MNFRAAYDLYKKDSSILTYECQEGTLVFYPSDSQTSVLIYSVEVKEDQRHGGCFGSLLEYIMSDPLVESLSVLACGNHMIEYLLYRRGFSNKGGDFTWNRDGRTNGIVKDLRGVSYEEYMKR